MKELIIPIRKFLGTIATRAFEDAVVESEKLALNWIKKDNIEDFLDIGCADGEPGIQFAKRVGAKFIYGVDLDDNLLAQAKSKGIECRKFDLNGSWDFQSDHFDLIFSRFNLEHLHSTRFFLKECHRCLKPGGELAIITENLASAINIAALILGWQPFSLTMLDGWWVGNPLAWQSGNQELEKSFDEWEDSGISGMMGHVRVIAIKAMKDLLKKVGFKDIQVSTRGYLPFWGKTSDILSKLDHRHGHILVAVCSK